MTQKELAKMIPVTPVWLSNIKAGKTPSPVVANRLMEITGVTLSIWYGPAKERKKKLDAFLRNSK